MKLVQWLVTILATFLPALVGAQPVDMAMADLDGALLSTNELAATLLVGVDVFRNERNQSTPYWRLVTGITIVGSTAINDFEIDLYAGDNFLGHYFLNVAGAAVTPALPDNLQPIAPTWVAPGTKVSGIITNAAVANPVQCKLYGRRFG